MYVMFTMLNTTCGQSMHFFFEIHYKPLHQTECCGVLIDNRSDAPIFVLEDNDRASKRDLDLSLRHFFEGRCHVEHVYKITPC